MKALYVFAMTRDAPVYHTFLTDDMYALEILHQRDKNGNWKFQKETYKVQETHPDVDWELWNLEYKGFVRALTVLEASMPGRGPLDKVIKDAADVEKEHQPLWFFWWEE